MYCKYCGKEIADDSKYCMYCGKDVAKEKQDSIQPPSNMVAKEDEENYPKGAKIIAVLIIVALFLGIVIFAIAEVGKASVRYRSAMTSDVTVTQEPTLSFSYNLTVTPKNDITDLEITFKFYGDNEQLIATKVKSLGKVSKNANYTVSFSLSEFSISSIWSISKYSWKVTGGQVKE